MRLFFLKLWLALALILLPSLAAAEERPLWLRLGAEAGLGYVAGAATAAAILLPVAYLSNPYELFPSGVPKGMAYGLMATAVLYPAGVGAGVLLGSQLTGTRSRYWEPFVGAYLGSLVSIPTAVFLQNDYPMLSAILATSLPVIFSIVLTESSHYQRKAADKQKALVGRVYMPLQFSWRF